MRKIRHEICLLDPQILMLEKRGHSIYILHEKFGCGQHETEYIKEAS